MRAHQTEGPHWPLRDTDGKGGMTMARDDEFRNRPIERSVIALGAVLGAGVYLVAMLLAIELYLKPAGI